MKEISIIAIEGPAVSGKGNLAFRLAKHFKFHYFNTGALYRLAAYEMKRSNIKEHEHDKIVGIVEKLSPFFSGEQVILRGQDIWPIIKTQEYGNLAALISPIKEVREVMYNFQRSMIKDPGLVVEGRGLLSHTFKDAHIKIYLDAHIDKRAERRYQNELSKVMEGEKFLHDFETIKKDILDRDHKDINREHGPLFRTEDSHYIDNTNFNLEETFEICKNLCEKILKEKN